MASNNCVNTYIVPTTGWEVTMPYQSAFSAKPTNDVANATGDGTAWTVAADEELFDQGGDYNTGTYTFTAPVDGIYHVIVQNALGAINGMNQITCRIYATVFTQIYMSIGAENCRSAANNLTMSVKVAIPMDASDTFYCTTLVGATGKTATAYEEFRIGAVLTC